MSALDPVLAISRPLRASAVTLDSPCAAWKNLDGQLGQHLALRTCIRAWVWSPQDQQTKLEEEDRWAAVLGRPPHVNRLQELGLLPLQVN